MAAPLNLKLVLQGVDRASSAINRIGSAFRQLATVAGGVFSARAIAGVAQEMGGLTDAAARLGATASGLARMQQAFDRVGLGADRVEGSLRAMRRALATDQGQRALQEIGVRLDEIAGAPAEQQFAVIGAAIAKIEDPIKRASAELRLFGRTGTEMEALFANADFASAWRDLMATASAATDEQLRAGDRLADSFAMLRAQAKTAFMSMLADAIAFWEGSENRADVALPLLATRFAWFGRAVTTRLGDLLRVAQEVFRKMFTDWREVLAWMGRGIWEAVKSWGRLLAQFGKNIWQWLTTGEWNADALRNSWRSALDSLKPDFQAIGIEFKWSKIEALDEVLARRRDELERAARAADAIGRRSTPEIDAEDARRGGGRAKDFAELATYGSAAAIKTIASAQATNLQRELLRKQSELVELARRQLGVLEALEVTP